MSQYKTEYSGTGVARSTTAGYSKLGCYYGSTGTMAPIKTTANAMVVPNWSSIGYDTLTRGVTNQSMYFNINDAYGAGASGCNQSFTTRMCGGCNK